jgi:hypothetical protein
MKVDDGLRTLHAGIAQATQELEDIRADRKNCFAAAAIRRAQHLGDT